jgi:diguanylate cyclase (GGDEF)-like protein/PAS domain S-box-containing protein
MFSENLYKSILDNIADGIYFVDKKRRINYWNKGAEQLSGRKCDEVMGYKCADDILVHTDDKGNRLCERGCPLEATLKDGQSRQANAYMLHQDGSRLPVSIKVYSICSDSGRITGAAQIFNDSSLSVRMQAKVRNLEKLVLLDKLTGIGNRRYAEIMLEERLNEFKQLGWPVGVIFSDIDNFKTVNDTYGHDVGDRVLKMVSRTISANLRATDIVCRWGSEEFLTLVANTSRDQVNEMAERIRLLVEGSAFALEKKVVSVTISSGVTIAREKDTSTCIVKRADSLMYDSKAAGKNCCKSD